MRLTADLDTNNPLVLMTSIFRGIYLTHRLPSTVKRSPSRHGWHIIFRHCDIDWETCLLYRKLIFDDPKRIHFDITSGEKRKATQVLFNKKTFTVKTPNGNFTFNQFQKDKIIELQRKYQPPQEILPAS